MSGYGDKPFGLREVTLLPLDGGSGVALPVDRVLKFKESVISGVQRGWSNTSNVITIGDAVEFELEAGGISLEAYALMTGRTVTTSGTTPNGQTRLSMAANRTFPFFALRGRALGDGADDLWVVIYKAKLIDGLSGTLQDGQFLVSNCKGVGIDDGVNGVWDMVQHETAVHLTFVIGVSNVGYAGLR